MPHAACLRPPRLCYGDCECSPTAMSSQISRTRQQISRYSDPPASAIPTRKGVPNAHTQHIASTYTSRTTNSQHLGVMVPTERASGNFSQPNPPKPWANPIRVNLWIVKFEHQPELSMRWVGPRVRLDRVHCSKSTKILKGLC